MVDLLERASEPLSSPNKRRQIGEEVPVSSNHSTANGMAATAHLMLPTASPPPHPTPPSTNVTRPPGPGAGTAIALERHL